MSKLINEASTFPSKSLKKAPGLKDAFKTGYSLDNVSYMRSALHYFNQHSNEGEINLSYNVAVLVAVKREQGFQIRLRQDEITHNALTGENDLTQPAEVDLPLPPFETNAFYSAQEAIKFLEQFDKNMQALAVKSYAYPQTDNFKYYSEYMHVSTAKLCRDQQVKKAALKDQVASTITREQKEEKIKPVSDGKNEPDPHL